MAETVDEKSKVLHEMVLEKIDEFLPQKIIKLRVMTDLGGQKSSKTYTPRKNVFLENKGGLKGGKNSIRFLEKKQTKPNKTIT